MKLRDLSGNVGNDPVDFNDPSGLAARIADTVRLEREQEACAGRRVSTPEGRGEDLLAAANEAVKTNLADPDCRGLFGAAHDPYEVLMDLQAGGKYGSIKFEDKPPDWGVAEERMTVGGFFSRILGGKASVTITINTYTPIAASGNSLWDYWNVGNHLANAETMLHELGHAFNDLFGRGGSQIVRDADRLGRPIASAQKFNANLLKTNCFKSAP